MSILPQSVTSQKICFAGLFAGVSAFFVLKELGVGTLGVVAGCLLALGLSIVILEYFLLKTWHRQSAGLTFSNLSPPKYSRILIKFLGLFVTYDLIALIYWIVPEYHGSLYYPFWAFIKLWWVYIVLAQAIYFIYLDRRMKKPEDGFWQIGMLAIGKWQGRDWSLIQQFVLGWLVKGFFLPLMMAYLFNNISRLLIIDQFSFANVDQWFEFLFLTVFSIDVAFAVLGYLMTIRLFDSHIRSVEPTLLGWSVAIVCYQPLWDFFSSHYLYFQDGYIWKQWLANAPITFAVWALVITLLNGIYVWSTVSFGLRFSNLTHRGIITNGPYRYSRHPAYIAKNLSWWLIAVPFLPVHGWDMAVRQSLALLALGGVYYLRAKTEERHLSKDSDYVKYANWVKKQGLLHNVKVKLGFG